MPTFRLHKLVRDNLIHIYDGLGETYQEQILSGDELKRALMAKLIEEVQELSEALGNTGDFISELADVQQILDDVKCAYGVLSTEVTEVQLAKFEKKGGFKGGHFVETITLQSDDEWVKYYRAKPDIFIEIPEK